MPVAPSPLCDSQCGIAKCPLGGHTALTGNHCCRRLSSGLWERGFWSWRRCSTTLSLTEEETEAHPERGWAKPRWQSWDWNPGPRSPCAVHFSPNFLPAKPPPTCQLPPVLVADGKVCLLLSCPPAPCPLPVCPESNRAALHTKGHLFHPVGPDCFTQTRRAVF